MSGRAQGVWVEAAVTVGAAVMVGVAMAGAVRQEVTAADTEAAPGAAHLNRF